MKKTNGGTGLNHNNADMHQRCSIRLKDYDYASEGTYFVTICTYNKECLFGDINDGELCLNQFGGIVFEEWEQSEKIRQEIELDEFVVMPNHLHGVVMIKKTVGMNCADKTRANGRSPLHMRPKMRPKSLSSFLSGFKSATSKRINLLRNAPGLSLWQRNYYEHIIRNEKELNLIRQYILDNPLKWALDEENPLKKCCRGERRSPF